MVARFQETNTNRADARILDQVDDISYMLAHDDTWVDSAQSFDGVVHGYEPGDLRKTDPCVRFNVLSAEGLLIALRYRFDEQRGGTMECAASSVEGRVLFGWRPAEGAKSHGREVFIIDQPLQTVKECQSHVRSKDAAAMLSDRHESSRIRSESTRLVVPKNDERHMLLPGDRYVRVIDTRVALAQAALVRERGWLSESIDGFWSDDQDETTQAQVIDINGQK